jgi:HSP20 family molecular chaperone IbpA
MAFILTPRVAPAYQAPQCNPFGLCAPVSRPSYGYRVARPRPQRPQYSSFNHFFSQVDDLLSEIDREAQRQAHLEAQREAQHQAHLEAEREVQRQLQERQRALRADFAVNQTEHGWQIDGDMNGFEQENISIEVTDVNTLKIAGNTRWQAEKAQSEHQQVEAAFTPDIEQQPVQETSEQETSNVTPHEPEYETITEADSDSASHKSYQPTVEDDFEDIGAETSSLVSTPSRPSSPAEVKEPKGKQRAFEETTVTESAVAQQPQPEAHVPQQQAPAQEERIQGFFERTIRFPERIDSANVSASFKDGTLKITVPKVQAQQVRRIAIL